MHSRSIAPHWTELMPCLNISGRRLSWNLLQILDLVLILANTVVFDRVRWRLHFDGGVGVYLREHELILKMSVLRFTVCIETLTTRREPSK
jgi:hypothetical protein